MLVRHEPAGIKDVGGSWCGLGLRPKMCRLPTPSAFLDPSNRLLALPTPVLLPSGRGRDFVGGLLLSHSGREAVRMRREEWI